MRSYENQFSDNRPLKRTREEKQRLLAELKETVRAMKPHNTLRASIITRIQRAGGRPRRAAAAAARSPPAGGGALRHRPPHAPPCPPAAGGRAGLIRAAGGVLVLGLPRA